MGLVADPVALDGIAVAEYEAMAFSIRVFLNTKKIERLCDLGPTAPKTTAAATTMQHVCQQTGVIFRDIHRKWGTKSLLMRANCNFAE